MLDISASLGHLLLPLRMDSQAPYAHLVTFAPQVICQPLLNQLVAVYALHIVKVLLLFFNIMHINIHMIKVQCTQINRGGHYYPFGPLHCMSVMYYSC